MNDFEALGTQFRQAREDRELSLQDVEQKTRIRVKYLQAIEHGNFHLIDTSTQVRGFLRSYANQVGLDADLLVRQYEEAQHGQRKRRRRRGKKGMPSAQIVSESAAPDPALFSESQRQGMKAIIAVLAAVLLTGAIVGGAVITINDLVDRTETPPPNEIQSVEIAPTRISPTPTEIILPTAITPPAFDGTEGLFVTITVQQRLWARITVDGDVRFEGIWRPGEGMDISGETITIHTSNASGLQLLINNQPYSLGESREAVEQTFSAGGISFPTPGPTTTPTVSYTPTNTFTPRASITATDTSTPTAETQASLPTATFFFTATPAVITPTAIPTIGFTTDTYTPSPTLPLPSATPTFTPSPILPPRETRTPTPDK